MDLLGNNAKAFLLLEDGTVFQGLALGAAGTAVGEVVFTTGMTAYEETLTDPSYYGQIITQTFPLVGNYGVNDEDVESERVYARGYIVREVCEHPSNFRCQHTLDQFLKEKNVVGIRHIDTRALTRRIRERGVMNGMILAELPENRDALLDQLKAFRIRDAVRNVTIGEAKVYPCVGELYHVALLDFGYKRNIRRSLLHRGCRVTVLPAGTSAAEILSGGFDGVMLSNGPGDPEEAGDVIANLRELAAADIPIFGICLGHQLLALAHGAKTAKLKYGHRGANQPVIDLNEDRTYVTSQNHGYEVLGDTLPAGVGRVSHLNGNDRSCEGVEYNDHMFTVQFHPEACGGPTDTSFLFDRFIAMMKKKKEGC